MKKKNAAKNKTSSRKKAEPSKKSTGLKKKPDKKSSASKKPAPSKAKASKKPLKKPAKKTPPAKKVPPSKKPEKKPVSKKKPAPKVSKAPSKKSAKPSVKASSGKNAVKSVSAKNAVKAASSKASKQSSKKVSPPKKPSKVLKKKGESASKSAAVRQEQKKAESKSSSKMGEQPAPITQKRGSHIRHSLNIYFSMADLDSYLERKNTLAKEEAEFRAAASARIAQKSGVKKVVAKESKSKGVIGVASIEDLLGFNLFEQPSRQKVEERDIPKKWKKYYNILMDMRRRYSAGASSRADEVLKRSAKEDSGDLSSYGQHLADAGSESFERDMAYNLLSTEKEMIREIDAAIERMKDGTYGICELTGKPIPEKRLLAVPFTRYTIEGQAIKDKENAHRKMASSTQGSPFGDMASDSSETEES